MYNHPACLPVWRVCSLTLLSFSLGFYRTDSCNNDHTHHRTTPPGPGVYIPSYLHLQPAWRQTTVCACRDVADHAKRVDGAELIDSLRVLCSFRHKVVPQPSILMAAATTTNNTSATHASHAHTQYSRIGHASPRHGSRQKNDRHAKKTALHTPPQLCTCRGKTTIVVASVLKTRWFGTQASVEGK